MIVQTVTKLGLTKGADRTETSIAITSAKTGDITTNNAASGSLYFLIKQSANNSTTYNVYLGSSTNEAAGSVVLADNTFTHFAIVYQDGTLSATIGSNATISAELSSETVGALKGLKTAESRGAGVVRIDNITLSKYLEAGTVAAPTFSVTGVNGISRTLAKILLIVFLDRPCQTIQCTSMFLNELTHLHLIDMAFVFRE